MQLTDDENVKKHGTLCKHCNRKTLLPYEIEWICISCGCNVIKRKHELFKTSRKKKLSTDANMLNTKYSAFA